MESNVIDAHGPSWELDIPSPARLQSGLAMCVPLQPMDPATPIFVKQVFGNENNRPCKRSVIGKSGGELSFDSAVRPPLSGVSRNTDRVKGAEIIPKVFLPANHYMTLETAELELSIYATIEKVGNMYVCMHDVADFVAKKVGASRCQVKWTHYNDKKYLFKLPDRVVFENFVEGNKTVNIMKDMVSFKPWQPGMGTIKELCHLKVWLKLVGLPVEYLTFNTTQIVVCSFGRLYSCNLEMTKSFIGCFYVNIDCSDLDAIRKQVNVKTDLDGEIPIYIEKLAACPIDVYQCQHLESGTLGYDEIMKTLIDCGKLVPLNNA